MPTLITGVTGYLGRALVNEYINTDKKVILTYRERKLDIKNKNFFWKKFASEPVYLNTRSSKLTAMISNTKFLIK